MVTQETNVFRKIISVLDLASGLKPRQFVN